MVVAVVVIVSIFVVVIVSVFVVVIVSIFVVVIVSVFVVVIVSVFVVVIVSVFVVVIVSVFVIVMHVLREGNFLSSWFCMDFREDRAFFAEHDVFIWALGYEVTQVGFEHRFVIKRR
jgi:hypothetical protein